VAKPIFDRSRVIAHIVGRPVRDHCSATASQAEQLDRHDFPGAEAMCGLQAAVLRQMEALSSLRAESPFDRNAEPLQYPCCIIRALVDDLSELSDVMLVFRRKKKQPSLIVNNRKR
jgi:hypothetical protein